MRYKNWNIKRPDVGTADLLSDRLGISELAALTLVSRGLDTPELAKAAFDTSIVHDPYLLKDMDKAAARVEQAIVNRETVAIYGDYDVDGVSSVALLVKYFKTLGLDCLYYIPTRFDEGYGVNPQAVEALAQKNVTLIITVDCGVTAVDEVSLAKGLGIDFVITDHHKCPEQLPEAVAVINPNRADCQYPNKNLAGVGVAYKLACAINKAPLPQLLDIAALGTIADVMPVTGENRAFIHQGLELINNNSSVSIKALLAKTPGADRKINADTVAFSIAPKLNAPGRLGHAATSVDLLLNTNPAKASVLADQVTELNNQRRELEDEIFAQAAKHLQAVSVDRNILVIWEQNWHQGVIGIVASRICERYGKPVIILSVENGVAKGSARSVQGYDIFAAISHCSQYLTRFGGHEHAAGLSLDAENLTAFSNMINGYEGGGQAPEPCLEIDAALSATSLTMSAVMGLDILQPHGTSNPTPVFCLENLDVINADLIGGGKHMKFKFAALGQVLDGVFFNSSNYAFLRPGDVVDLAFLADINSFNGRTNVQLMVKDIRPCQTERELQSQSRVAFEQFIDTGTISPEQARLILPTQKQFAGVWRYFKNHTSRIDVNFLYKYVNKEYNIDINTGCALMAIKVFEQLGLCTTKPLGDFLTITLADTTEKVDLQSSGLLAEFFECAGAN